MGYPVVFVYPWLDHSDTSYRRSLVDANDTASNFRTESVKSVNLTTIHVSFSDYSMIKTLNKQLRLYRQAL